MTREESAETITTPRSTAGMTTKVVKGSVWTLIGQVAPMAVSLITTPFVIRMLGAEGYGVVALVALIPPYLAFADLGMGLASTKFGSEAFGAGNATEEARVVRTAAAIALAAVLPIAAVIFAFSDLLTSRLNVPDQLHSDASLAFKFGAISLIFYLLNNIVNTPQLARLRMDLNTFVGAGARILGTLAVPVVVYAGGGAAGAVSAVMAANILMFAGHVVVSGRLNRELFHLSIDERVIRPLLKFGGPLAISSIAGAFVVSAERLILTERTSVEQLGYYAVAYMLTNAVTLFGVSMAQSSIPAFSQVFSPEKREQLLTLYSRVLRISIFSLLPLITILFVIARPFFAVWAGPDFARESTVPFYILLCAMIFNLNSYVPAALVMAAGRSDIFAKLYWIELVPYILAAIVLTGAYGAVGAAAAWSLRTIVDALAFFWLARRIAGVGIDLRQIWSRLGASLAVLLVPILLAVFFPQVGEWLCGFVLFFSLVIYAVLLWAFILTRQEKLWLSSHAGWLLKQRTSVKSSSP